MSFTSHFDDTSATAAAIAGTVEACIGLILNLLNVFVLWKSDKLRSNVITPLICALTLSDIIFCLSLILTVYQFRLNQPFPENDFLCSFYPIIYR